MSEEMSYEEMQDLYDQNAQKDSSASDWGDYNDEPDSSRGSQLREEGSREDDRPRGRAKNRASPSVSPSRSPSPSASPRVASSARGVGDGGRAKDRDAGEDGHRGENKNKDGDKSRDKRKRLETDDGDSDEGAERECKVKRGRGPERGSGDRDAPAEQRPPAPGPRPQKREIKDSLREMRLNLLQKKSWLVYYRDDASQGSVQPFATKVFQNDTYLRDKVRLLSEGRMGDADLDRFIKANRGGVPQGLTQPQQDNAVRVFRESAAAAYVKVSPQNHSAAELRGMFDDYLAKMKESQDWKSIQSAHTKKYLRALFELYVKQSLDTTRIALLELAALVEVLEMCQKTRYSFVAVPPALSAAAHTTVLNLPTDTYRAFDLKEELVCHIMFSQIKLAQKINSSAKPERAPVRNSVIGKEGAGRVPEDLVDRWNRQQTEALNRFTLINAAVDIASKECKFGGETADCAHRPLATRGDLCAWVNKRLEADGHGCIPGAYTYEFFRFLVALSEKKKFNVKGKSRLEVLLPEGADPPLARTKAADRRATAKKLEAQRTALEAQVSKLKNTIKTSERTLLQKEQKLELIKGQEATLRKEHERGPATAEEPGRGPPAGDERYDDTPSDPDSREDGSGKGKGPRRDASSSDEDSPSPVKKRGAAERDGRRKEEVCRGREAKGSRSAGSSNGGEKSNAEKDEEERKRARRRSQEDKEGASDESDDYLEEEDDFLTQRAKFPEGGHEDEAPRASRHRPEDSDDDETDDEARHLGKAARRRANAVIELSSPSNSVKDRAPEKTGRKPNGDSMLHKIVKKSSK